MADRRFITLPSQRPDDEIDTRGIDPTTLLRVTKLLRRQIAEWNGEAMEWRNDNPNLSDDCDYASGVYSTADDLLHIVHQLEKARLDALRKRRRHG